MDNLKILAFMCSVSANFILRSLAREQQFANPSPDTIYREAPSFLHFDVGT